jgi:uncharacterized membrane protein
MFGIFGTVAYAETVDTLLKKINKALINPLIVLVFAIALVYFLYGLVDFIANPDNTDKREEGKQHMLWGVIGMFIMMAVFTIMRILANTLGSSVTLPHG